MKKEEIAQAEIFLDAYLGGNRNVSTLTWNHWVECLYDYGNKLQSENERLKAERDNTPIFHTCPECTWACSCSDQPCSCCKSQTHKQ